jgi:glutamate/tyrosine decarboxylase-like PLP-dependent enzyme
MVEAVGLNLESDIRIDSVGGTLYSVLMKESIFRRTLETALDSALSYLDGLDRMPVASHADLETVRRRLAKPLTDTCVPPEAVIADLARAVEGAIMGSAGGRFFGWVIGGSLPAALAADWLTSTWDQNAALYSCGPAAAVVEEVAGSWLKELIGLPVEASFAFVTGTQMAHFTCLAAARHAVLGRLGWDVEKQGLFGAPPIRVLSNGQRHGSVERAVRYLGIGGSNIVDLPTDSMNRVIPAALERALHEASPSPTIVILQAGDICTGAFDDFETLIPLARKYGAWVHVDGAFGLWAGASSKHRYLVRGVERADSWTTDGHKWLNVPFDSGYAFIADAKAHIGSMSHRAVYLTHDEEARDQIDWNPEWSRRARGFATYAAIRQLGRRGVADLIERCCEHTKTLVTRLGELPVVEVLSPPILNQALVRFVDSGAEASEQDHDRRTDEVIAAVAATGEAFFTSTTWHGQRAMRVSVCNWSTSEDDVARALKAFVDVLEQLRARDCIPYTVAEVDATF